MRIVSLRAAATIAGLIGLGACDSGPQPSTNGGASVHDSAGIAIVHDEVHGHDTLSVEEVLRIGVIEGPEELLFDNIVDIEVEVSRNRVFVLDRGFGSVRVFTLEGEFQREFGRPGDGPGEFRSPSDVEVAGDTVAVLDQNSIHLFEPGGAHTGTLAVSSPEAGERIIPVSLSHDSGGWFTLASVIRRVPGETSENLIRTYRLNPTGGGAAPAGFEIEPVPGRQVTPSGTSITPFLAHRIEPSMDELGRIHFAPSGDYALHVARPDGSLERIHRLTSKRVPVESGMLEEHLAAAEERCLAVTASSECRIYLDQILPAQVAIGPPEFVPVVEQLIISDSGHALVQRRDLHPNPFRDPSLGVHDVIDAEGAFVGRFRPPDSFRPMWFDHDEVWGVKRDDLDVPYVVKLTMSRVFAREEAPGEKGGFGRRRIGSGAP